MRALGLGCARLESNDLPVCFFASMEDGALGVSRLIEFDPSGYLALAADPAVRSHYSRAAERILERFRRFATDSTEMAGLTVPTRALVRRRLGVDSVTFDRILADHPQGRQASTSDTLLATHEWLSQASPRQQARSHLRMSEGAFDSVIADANVREPALAVDLLLAVALSRLDQQALFSVT
jgi:hypothetical protein